MLVAVGWPRSPCSLSSGCASGRLQALRAARRSRSLALFAGYWLSGAGLDLLKPRHWDELLSGLGGGLQALGTVRLPYASADPWPRIVLELLGAELLILAGLLTFWPRAGDRADARVPLTPPERGYPFVALAVLIVVVASPIVSLGGTARPLLLGLALAALTVCFLWLERLPLRPGLGVAGLLAVALLGALPVAARADRGEPWFDYRSFAESLGPDDPVRFSWTQSYGPITWPRDGNEVMRVVSARAAVLEGAQPRHVQRQRVDDARGRRSTRRARSRCERRPARRTGRTARRGRTTIEVSIRRMRITRRDRRGHDRRRPGRLARRRAGPLARHVGRAEPLRRGDSYTAERARPEPRRRRSWRTRRPARTSARTASASSTVPFKPGEVSDQPQPAGIIAAHRGRPDHRGRACTSRAGTASAPTAPPTRRVRPLGVRRRRASWSAPQYERTWELVEAAQGGTDDPWTTSAPSTTTCTSPSSATSSGPPQAPVGQAPLDYFINESHEGYCQHYAGAMALMLRMGGIPARVATGFSPGGYSTRKKAWIVRDTDAHAWVEVWFDQLRLGHGRPDAGRARPPARTSPRSTPAPGAAPPAAAADTGAADAAANAETTRTDLAAPGAAARHGRRPMPGAATDSGGARVLGLGARRRRPRRARARASLLFLRRPRGTTPMDRAIAEVEDALERVGRPVTDRHDDDASSNAGSARTRPRSRRTCGAGRGALRASLRPPPPRTGRRALRRALAQGLGFGGGLRALWALPPRVERGWPRTPRRGRSRSTRACGRDG